MSFYEFNFFSGPERENSRLSRQEYFLLVLSALYSRLIHLPPLRFHCVEGCWDSRMEPRTVPTSALAVRRSNHSARSHPFFQPDLIHLFWIKMTLQFGHFSKILSSSKVEVCRNSPSWAQLRLLDSDTPQVPLLCCLVLSVKGNTDEWNYHKIFFLGQKLGTVPHTQYKNGLYIILASCFKLGALASRKFISIC